MIVLLVLPGVYSLQAPELGRVLPAHQHTASPDIAMEKIFAMKELLVKATIHTLKRSFMVMKFRCLQMQNTGLTLLCLVSLGTSQ